jgi:hypothetical protein
MWFLLYINLVMMIPYFVLFIISINVLANFMGMQEQTLSEYLFMKMLDCTKGFLYKPIYVQ